MTFKPSQFYDFVVPANGAYQLTVMGDYFKIMSCTGPVGVKSDWGELKGLIGGQGLEASPFTRLYITDMAGVPNTVRIFVGDEKFIDGLGGSFKVDDPSVPLAVMDNLQKTVTNASGLLVAAKPGRRYLLVQNKDATGDVYLAFGKAATIAAGVRVIAGGAFELVGVATPQDVYAIGSVASNPNIVVVEG